MSRINKITIERVIIMELMNGDKIYFEYSDFQQMINVNQKYSDLLAQDARDESK